MSSLIWGSPDTEDSIHRVMRSQLSLLCKRPVTHSFENLEAIVCWSSRLKDGQEVIDLRGQKGTYKVSVDGNGKKARFIVIPNSARNVEVLVFRELLEKRGYKFQNIGE